MNHQLESVIDPGPAPEQPAVIILNQSGQQADVGLAPSLDATALLFAPATLGGRGKSTRDEPVGGQVTFDARPKPVRMVAYQPRPTVEYLEQDESTWWDRVRPVLSVLSTLCFVLAALCFIWYLTHSPATSGSSQQAFSTRKIEDCDVGMRVIGKNPDRAQVESAPEPDPATSRKLVLRLTKEGGGKLTAKLLRSLAWIEANEVLSGGTFFLDLPEMGAVGDAYVEAILPCPLIEPGPGNVVTGTFAHEASADQTILSVTFANGAHIHGVTDNHPVYSVDRQQFLPIGEMRQGETVQGADGTTFITATTTRPAIAGEMLYNLETHNEHVYQVTTAGILVHNSCILGRYADDGGHHIFAKRAFEGLPGYKPGEALALGQSELSRLGLKHLGSDSLTTTQQRLFRELAASGRANTLAEHARIARETLIEHGVDPKDAASAVKSALNQLKSWEITSPVHIPWGG